MKMKMPKVPMMACKSHMPKGGTLSPKGDIGALRVAEAESVFSRRSLKGKGERNPFGKSIVPATGIDKQFGPPDKVC